MKRLFGMFSALALVLALGSIVPEPAEAHPISPGAFDVCNYLEGFAEDHMNTPLNMSEWRSFHYGETHIWQCEYIIVFAYPWTACFMHVQGDPTLYQFVGRTVGDCW